MSGERTVPILPCAGLEETLAFYGAIGFAITYRQQRPNPYAVVECDDIVLHLAEVPGFDPASSYASVIITVPDLDAVHDSIVRRLRAHHGRVPVSGIPRLLRLRRKAGTATGFSLVDAGGNWLRFYQAGGSEEETARTGLGRVIDVAARQADARGDDAQALAVLEAGLLRHPDAAPSERDEAVAYLAELRERVEGARG